jgi:hypothetical protein
MRKIMSDYTPIEELEVGDEVILTGEYWDWVVSKNNFITFKNKKVKIVEKHQDAVFFLLDGQYAQIDNEGYSCIKVEVQKEEPLDFFFETPVMLADNPNAYYEEVENRIISEAKEKAESFVRRTYPAWPYHKEIKEVLDRRNKMIKFAWVSKDSE